MKSNSKTAYFLIFIALVIIALVIVNGFNNKANEENSTFGKITIGEKFDKKSFSEEFDIVKNNKVMDNYEFPDHTKVYIDRMIKLYPRKNNPNGDENNYLKFMSNEVSVGLNENKEVGVISFDIINDNNNFGKILKTLKDKNLKVISSAISKTEDGKDFNYTIQYAQEENSELVTVLLLQSNVYYDMISEGENEKEIKLNDIKSMSISFYNKLLLENEGDISIF